MDYLFKSAYIPETVVFDHVFLQHLVQRRLGHLAFSFLLAQHLQELGVVLLLKLSFRLHREIELRPSRLEKLE